jgi:glycosyltransferase involved in cell wall biosynthesis
VVVNTYNGATHLRACLDSVLAQTYQHWELVFWDNQSTDGSAAIARSYAEPRIRYCYASAHTSLGEARNQAVRESRGEWVAFLDSDDVWLPEKLEWQIDAVNTAPVRPGIVYGRTLCLTDDVVGPELYADEVGPTPPSGQILDVLLERGNLIALSSVMVLRQAFLDMGGIPPQFDYSEDYYLLAAIAAKYQAVAVNRPCCLYRIHPLSMTARRRARGYEETIEIIATLGSHNPRLVKRKCAEYSALLGLERILVDGDVMTGLNEILVRGSLLALAGRAVAKVRRTLSRAW